LSDFSYSNAVAFATLIDSSITLLHNPTRGFDVMSLSAFDACFFYSDKLFRLAPSVRRLYKAKVSFPELGWCEAVTGNGMIRTGERDVSAASWSSS